MTETDNTILDKVPEELMNKLIINFDINETRFFSKLNLSEGLMKEFYKIYSQDMEAKRKEIIKNYCI
jgi:hypothetical protein